MNYKIVNPYGGRQEDSLLGELQKGALKPNLANLDLGDFEGYLSELIDENDDVAGTIIYIPEVTVDDIDLPNGEEDDDEL